MFAADCANRDPFRGLPDDFPDGHSRFPLVPCEGYGDLSFVRPFGDNVAPEEPKVEMTPTQRNAWRYAMMQALGDLVEIPPVDRHDD